jgi:hypothetical protein
MGWVAVMSAAPTQAHAKPLLAECCRELTLIRDTVRRMNLSRFSIMDRSFSRRRRALLGTTIALPLGATSVLAESSDKPTSLRDFFRTPGLSGVVFAPDGKHIAGLRDVRGRLNISVVDVTARKALVITTFTDGDVRWVRWVNNERLVFSMYDRQRGSGDQVGGGLFAINHDASDYRILADRSNLTEGQRLMPAATTFHSTLQVKGQLTDEVIVEVPSMQAQGKFSSNLHRLDTTNGRNALLTLGGPSDVIAWVADRDAVPRAAVSVREGFTRIHLRDSEQSPWRVIFEFGPEDVAGSVRPLQFDGSGSLYVSAYAGQDNAAIYRYDVKAGRLDPEPVVALKGFDLSEGLRFSADGQRLLGIDYEADREGTYWVDDSLAKIQAQVDQVLPKRVNRLQLPRDPASSPVLVRSFSDRDPGHYYLFNTARGTIESISQSRPWINVDHTVLQVRIARRDVDPSSIDVAGRCREVPVGRPALRRALGSSDQVGVGPDRPIPCFARLRCPDARASRIDRIWRQAVQGRMETVGPGYAGRRDRRRAGSDHAWSC